ncbi:Ldh family oxidoreductase [Gelria sp. Kuro-4]|uniref:Ldh family oxidoreductase n=1 Tax=Gelria sp. Kuro-4 TaxID=2796927 RepID=UPI001C7ED343|nr:Ldh family oxidoreductase [Gelria sp. Kuro-4]
MNNREPLRIPASILRSYAEAVLIASGAVPEDAEIVADNLIDASLSGIDSHGISRLGIYCKRLKLGLVAHRTEVKVIRDAGIAALLSGGNGSGPVVGVRAMDLAIAKAKKFGLGIVGVRDSNHCGALAYYTSRAVTQNLIGFATTNAPSTMPPWGARVAYFGTNPLSYAIPTGDPERPIVFDIATSTVARGKIILAAKANKPIPEGWALDKDGYPTTDPKEALEGLVLPLGGAKGSGLALLVEILSGVMTGAAVGPQIGSLYDDFQKPQGVGHFFAAMQVGLLVSERDFYCRINELSKRLVALPPALGHEEVLLPGEPERRIKRERMDKGIPLTTEIMKELIAVGQSCGQCQSLRSYQLT